MKIFDVWFDTEALKLMATGDFRDGTLIVERINSPVAARQVSESVKALCGGSVAFRLRPSAKAWESAFTDVGAVVVP